MKSKLVSRREPIDLLLRPFHRFMEMGASGGILLLLCTIIALVWANSPWKEGYLHLWEHKLTIGFDNFYLSKNLHHWINDGLMALFFFVVGLEIKREILVGELASFKQSALPIAAALGGMLVPAGFYLLFNAGGAGARGWGIPMATDIAFAPGVLTLLGDRVPLGLKVFLTALAIVDDIGAVLVIALFYTAEISWASLGVGFGILAILMLLNWAGARHPAVYLPLGFVLWLAFLKSGVHATVSGVLLAMTIPARQRLDAPQFLEQSRRLLREFEESLGTGEARHSVVQSIEKMCERTETPMQRFEHALLPWVTYFIMPVFALANAGVTIQGSLADSLVHPISLGIVAGLFLGKPVGIALFSWLAVRFGVASLPANVNWRQVTGVGVIGGIGFTMSLFVAGLAFGSGALQDISKVGVLSASLIAGVVGSLLLRKVTNSDSNAGDAGTNHEHRVSDIDREASLRPAESPR